MAAFMLLMESSKRKASGVCPGKISVVVNKERALILEDTIYEELNVGEITRDKDGCRVQDISKKVIAEISILRSCKSPAQFSVTKYLLHFSQIKSEIPQLNICKNKMQDNAEKTAH